MSDKKKMTAEEAEAKGLPLAKAQIHEEVLNVYLTLMKGAMDDDTCPAQVKDECVLLTDDILKMDGELLTITTVGSLRCFMAMTDALKKITGLKTKEVSDEGELTN